MISLVLTLVGSLALFYLGHLTLRNRKLSRFPGPPLAGYTDLWLVWHIWKTRDVEPLREVHQKYGPVVRIAPNKLSFRDYTAAKDIYAPSRDLKKSPWYGVLAPTAGGYVVENYFASQNIEYHDNIRRMIHKLFSMGTVASYEPRVLSVVETFIEQMDKRFADRPGADGVFDFSIWAQYYTGDAISEIAFSKAYGFLESDTDVADLLRDNRFFFKYAHFVGAAPWLDHFGLKNPLLLWLNRKGIAQFNPEIAIVANKSQSSRQQELSAGAQLRNDMQDYIINCKTVYPELVDDDEIVKLVVGIIFAGIDTSAMFISAMMRYILKNPKVYARLQQDLDQSESLSYFRPEASPYLDAVIKESARMFPVVRFPFERITPSSGMSIDGNAVPGGTTVCTSPWVMHRDPSVWGEDVDTFRPERWLGIDEARYKSMANKLMLFGTGKYLCEGVHITYSETWRLISALLKTYQIELANPDTDWKLEYGALAFVSELNIRVKRRT